MNRRRQWMKRWSFDKKNNHVEKKKTAKYEEKEKGNITISKN